MDRNLFALGHSPGVVQSLWTRLVDGREDLPYGRVFVFAQPQAAAGLFKRFERDFAAPHGLDAGVPLDKQCRAVVEHESTNMAAEEQKGCRKVGDVFSQPADVLGRKRQLHHRRRPPTEFGQDLVRRKSGLWIHGPGESKLWDRTVGPIEAGNDIGHSLDGTLEIPDERAGSAVELRAVRHLEDRLESKAESPYLVSALLRD